ncbi:MAG: hypothetical protein Q4A52_05960 [Bacillota bacterium]|nr:hypothetical protein [Bacillota bacterium]
MMACKRWRNGLVAAVLAVALLFVLSGCIVTRSADASNPAHSQGDAGGGSAGDAGGQGGSSGDVQGGAEGTGSGQAGGSGTHTGKGSGSGDGKRWSTKDAGAFVLRESAKVPVEEREGAKPDWADVWRFPELRIEHAEAVAFSERLNGLGAEIEALYARFLPEHPGLKVEADYRYRVDAERGLGGLVVAARLYELMDDAPHELASRVLTLSLDLPGSRFLTAKELNERYGYTTLYDRMESAMFEIAGEYYADLEFDRAIGLYSESLLRFWTAGDRHLVYLPREAEGTDPAGGKNDEANGTPVGEPDAWWEVKSRSYGYGDDGERLVRGHSHEDNPLALHGDPRSLTYWFEMPLESGDWGVAPFSPDDFLAHQPHLNPDYWTYANLMGPEEKEGGFGFVMYLGRLAERETVERRLSNFLKDAGIEAEQLLYLDARAQDARGADGSKTVLHLLIPKYFEAVTARVDATEGAGHLKSLGTLVLLTTEQDRPQDFVMRYREESLVFPARTQPGLEREFPLKLWDLTAEVEKDRSLPTPDGVTDLLNEWESKAWRANE